jgi:hypothetical protein
MMIGTVHFFWICLMNSALIMNCQADRQPMVDNRLNTDYHG